MVCQSRGPEPGPADHHGEPNEYTHALSASDPYRNLQMLITVCSTKCSSHSALHRPHATATALAVSAETFSDRAATRHGPKRWELRTLQARQRWDALDLCWSPSRPRPPSAENGHVSKHELRSCRPCTSYTRWPRAGRHL